MNTFPQLVRDALQEARREGFVTALGLSSFLHATWPTALVGVVLLLVVEFVCRRRADRARVALVDAHVDALTRTH